MCKDLTPTYKVQQRLFSRAIENISFVDTSLETEHDCSAVNGIIPDLCWCYFK